MVLTQQNARAYVYYLECDAVGHFPDEPIVRANSVIIKSVLTHHEQLIEIKLAGMKVRGV